MFKRLSISLLLMGLAAFSLGAAAFAWFSDSGTGQVTVTAGDADLQFRVDFDCDNEIGAWDTGYFQAESEAFPFLWDGGVPGDTTADCIEVNNNGEGTLTVFVKNSDFTGNGTLLASTSWQYNAIGTGSVNCPATAPNHAQYITGRGCQLDTIAPEESFVLRVDVEFVDNGSNQNGLQSQTFGFTSTLTGYTG
jgi:hypothetical protein